MRLLSFRLEAIGSGTREDLLMPVLNFSRLYFQNTLLGVDRLRRWRIMTHHRALM